MKNSKAPFILVLVGIIFGAAASVGRILQYGVFRSAERNAVYDELFGMLGIDFSTIMTWLLVSSVIALVISLILVWYVIKISKTPTKTDFVVTTVLGAVGMVFGMGFGGILVLIGGIIGIANAKSA